MKEFLPVIRSSQLFSGIAEEELEPMLSCLEARREAFPKDAFLLRVGDTAESVGIVLSGSIIIIQEDIWGNRNILSKAGQGQAYAAAFACAPGAVLNVSVVAETPVTVMLPHDNNVKLFRRTIFDHFQKVRTVVCLCGQSSVDVRLKQGDVVLLCKGLTLTKLTFNRFLSLIVRGIASVYYSCH